MSLMKKISEDMTAAMRARDQARLAPLRMAKAALMNREVEKGRELDDAESQQVIASLIKQRRDSADQFTKGGREVLRPGSCARSRRGRSLKSGRWRRIYRPRSIRPRSNTRSMKQSRRPVPRRRRISVV